MDRRADTLGRGHVDGRPTVGRGADAPGGSAAASWEQSGEPGHTHDPHEVTVQLDGVGRRKTEAWLVQQAKDAPGVQDGSDGPVFVDESGRRSRRFRRLGILVGIACAVYAVVIVATLLSGNSNAPWLPVPGQQDDTPAGKVDTSPLPTDSVSPSGSSSAAPGASASASDGTAPAPGVSPTPGASASATDPGTSADPKPSTSATTRPKPSTSTTKDPVIPPSLPVSGSPDPSPSEDGAASPSPSESTVGAGGTGTVADSPVEPGPIASEPGITSSSSPENPVSPATPQNLENIL
ncbi:hypothetical protein ACFVYV_03995 [Streptomyces mirabilis]|uniref:hypothetical protein n=1 Tax=Streptomyces mirabilis TaxID=68239 RepID=UPI0036D7ED9D